MDGIKRCDWFFWVNNVYCNKCILFGVIDIIINGFLLFFLSVSYLSRLYLGRRSY